MPNPIKKAAPKAAAPMSQGIGESKRHNAPEGTFEDTNDWSTATVEGKPIKEAAWGSFPWRFTDQGMQELNGGRPVQPKTVDEIRARRGGSDAIEKAIAARNTLVAQGLPVPRQLSQVIAQARANAGDDVTRGGDHIAAFRDGLKGDELALQDDPLRVSQDLHTPAGHHGLFLSKRQIKEFGWQRGVLEYAPVLDDAGAPIEVGGMILGSVPIGSYNRSLAHYAEKAQERQMLALGQVEESTDRVMSQAKVEKLMQRRRASEYNDGVQAEDPDAAFDDLSDGAREVLVGAPDDQD